MLHKVHGCNMYLPENPLALIQYWAGELNIHPDFNYAKEQLDNAYEKAFPAARRGHHQTTGG